MELDGRVTERRITFLDRLVDELMENPDVKPGHLERVWDQMWKAEEDKERQQLGYGDW